VQFEFNLRPAGVASTRGTISVGLQHIPLAFVRNPRARRYILRLTRDIQVRVTIPRCGSQEEARSFAERNRTWLEQQIQRRAEDSKRPREWRTGADILFRGESVKIQVAANGQQGLIQFGCEKLRVDDPAADLRHPIELHLWKLAMKELPARVLELAAAHRLHVRRVSVRNQRSRWGSCSRRGTISLNWRLVQAPSFVSDYIIVHELMHLRQMNHSPRFWSEVAQAFPDYQSAEHWLKEHSALVGHLGESTGGLG
jgi:hypothetical protein